MGMMDIEPFAEAKPSIFPPSVDVRPKKVWKLEDGTELKSNSLSFDQNLSKALNTSSTSKEQDTAAANIKAARQTESIYEGIGGFIPRELLAKIIQTKDKGNYENTNDPKYQYLPDKLETPFYQSDSTVEQDIFSAEFLTKKSEIPGAENTMAHNANLLYGIGTNPFMKSDADYKLFENNPFYKDLHTQSKSPRSILQKLDPKFWASMNDNVTLIQNTQVPGTSNPLSGNSLNWKDAPNPFSDTQKELTSMDINANYHTVIASQLWRGWKNNDIFSFINRAWESRTRVESTMREILGKSADQTSTPVTTDSATSTTPTTAGKEDSLAVKKVKTWWDSIGSKLGEAEVLPFGLLSSMAPDMSEMMDWGNWGDENAQAVDSKKATPTVASSGFREKMISGYLQYTSDQYIMSKFKSGKPLAKKDLILDNTDQINLVWDNLVAKGYIDQAGNVKSSFDAKNPDFQLNIGLSPQENDEVRTRLRESVIGQFSLDIQDKTLVNGKNRHDIALTGADGKTKTLAEVMDLINSGQDGIERINNAKEAYGYLFNMHAAMTGLSDPSSPENTGALQYKTLPNTQVQVTLASQGEWKEWGIPTNSSAGWESKQGPIVLQFDSLQDAEGFKNNIRMLMALLEPVVGTFNPNEADGSKKPLNILVDNTGASTSTAFVKEGDPNYKLSVDTPFDKSFFKSQEWEDAASLLSKKTIGTITYGIFSRSEQNKILSMEHKKKTEGYDDRKEEYEQDEVKRIIQENDRRNEQIEEQQIAEQKSKEARDRAEEDDIIAANKRRAEEQQSSQEE